LPPDDVADLLQRVDQAAQEKLFSLLDSVSAKEVRGLLAYKEDHAGGLMSPRFLRLRPELTVDEALRYVRAQAAEHLETIRYLYVLDTFQKLLGIVSLRQLFFAQPAQRISEIMRTDVVSLPEDMDQEKVSHVFSQTGLMAVPVVTKNDKMVGIVTVDDIVDVVKEEATEDIQKFGAQEVLDAPYLRTSYFELIRKRAGWLTILFVGGTFTASALGFFEEQIEKTLILTLFIPLIVSSGGNSGSQAATLIIRSLTLRELRLRDWWRVLWREIVVGLSVGLLLGVLGFARVLFWPEHGGENYFVLSFTIAASITSVVLWGTMIGSMLPFILRSFRLDPAAASAPLVATLVDVIGIIIYFSIAKLLLGGMMG
jgi:magnesium transporter